MCQMWRIVIDSPLHRFDIGMQSSLPLFGQMWSSAWHERYAITIIRIIRVINYNDRHKCLTLSLVVDSQQESPSSVPSWQSTIWWGHSQSLINCSSSFSRCDKPCRTSSVEVCSRSGWRRTDRKQIDCYCIEEPDMTGARLRRPHSLSGNLKAVTHILDGSPF